MRCQKHFYTIKINTSVNFYSWVSVNYERLSKNPAEVVRMLHKVFYRWSLFTPYSWSWYRTGTSLQPRLMWEDFSNANDINLVLMIFPRTSLHCILVLVHYQECQSGVLKVAVCSQKKTNNKGKRTKNFSSTFLYVSAIARNSHTRINSPRK